MSTSGLFATPTPTPLGIPISDGSGFIDPGWLKRADLTAPNSIFQVTNGSSVLFSPGADITLLNQSANKVWAGPTTGSPAQPTFRILVGGDIPDLSGSYLVRANNLSDLISVSTARTNLGATTTGSNLFTLTDGSAISFFRRNADNTISSLDAADFRTAIGAGTGSGTVTNVSGTAPVVSSGGTTPAISMPVATGSVDGYLSHTDWTTFNSKQTAGNYITALTGDVTASGPGSAGATIASSAVTLGKMANLAANSIIGNNTVSPATPIALTTTQVKTLLSLNNVENTALSTWSGSSNLTTAGALSASSLFTTGTLTAQGLTAASGTYSIATVSDTGDFATLASVPVIKGGTGLTSLASGKMLYASASNTISALSQGNSITISGGVLDTIQDLRTIASPSFSNTYVNNFIGVGTNSPDYRITVTGDAHTRIRLNGTTTSGFFFTVNGVDAGTVRGDGSKISFFVPTFGELLAINSTGVVESLGSIKTSSPSGGTAQPIKFGSYVAGAPTPNGYLEVESNGVAIQIPVYKP